MTIPRFIALNRYWENHPPTHVSSNAVRRMVANYLGYKEIVPDQIEATLEQVSEHVPVQTVTAEEFNDVLKRFNLPINTADPQK